MKKSSTIIIVSAALFALTLLSSCQNFLKGGEVKKEIEDVIDYNNAPSVPVYIKSNMEYGEFLPDGEKSFKVGYDNLVQFSLNKANYVFEKLEAVSRTSQDQSRNEYVQFTPVELDTKKGIYKINVKILSQINDIMIRPVCKALPKIDSIVPVLESNGCNQDSAIVFTFNKKMNTASFRDADGKIKGISITSSDGDDLTEYFDEPCFAADDKSLHILPLCLTDNTKFLLPPDGPKKTLNIEVSFSFIDVKDEDGLSLTTNGIYNYKINQKFTAQKDVNIRIQNENTDFGSFLADGDKDCIVGFSFDVQFTLKKDTHIFLGFEAVGKDGVTSRADCVSFENLNYDEETGICSATVTIIQNNSDIIIRPKCEKITNRDIFLDGANGKLSPSRGLMVERIKSREYTISFEPDSDYEFLYWQVFDKSPDANEQVIPNGTYITITDPSKEDTSYKLTTIPEDNSIQLAIRPVVAERPQILLTSPTYDPEGSWRDTTIQVVFDYDMDPNCIFYDDEKNEREIIEQENPGIVFLESSYVPGKFFGYKKIVDNEEIYFYKNIMIEEKRSGKNLTKYYGEPYFDDPNTLFIPVVDATKLEEGMNIKVMIDKGFSYKIDGVSVCMNRSEKWLYLINGNTDNIAPSYTIGGFSVAECTVPDGGETAVSIATDGSDIASKLSGKFRTVNNMKLTLTNLKVTDTGSNPDSSFSVVYKKIYDSAYNKIAKPARQSQNISYKSVQGQVAKFSGDIELKNLEDGIYEIKFEFRDRSNNHADYPAPIAATTTGGTDTPKAYYICVDTKPLDAKSPSLSFVSCPSDGKTNLQFTYSKTDKDLHHTVVKWREYTGNTAESSWAGIDGTPYTRGQALSVPELTNGKLYEVHAQFFDAAGNSSTLVTSRYSMPNKVSGISVEQEIVPSDTSGNYTGKAKLSWTKPTGALDSYEIEVYTRDFKDYDQVGYKDTYTKVKTVTVSNSQTSCTIEDIPYTYSFHNIPVYKFNIISVLSGSQVSYCSVTKEEMAPPPAVATPSSLTYNTSTMSGGTYGLYGSVSKPVVSYSGSTLDNFWDENHNYYTVYLYLGAHEEDVKTESNTNAVALSWESTNYLDRYKLNGPSFNIQNSASWFVDISHPYTHETVYKYGLNGSSIYYAIKTVYNNGQGYESASWSEIKKFPPEKENLSYEVKQKYLNYNNNRANYNTVYLSAGSTIKWRKKGSSTWYTGNRDSSGYVKDGGEIAYADYGNYSYTIFDSGATYEFIVESRENWGNSSNIYITHNVIKDRTQLEITIP